MGLAISALSAVGVFVLSIIVSFPMFQVSFGVMCKGWQASRCATVHSLYPISGASFQGHQPQVCLRQSGKTWRENYDLRIAPAWFRSTRKSKSHRAGQYVGMGLGR
jgi:hypothetical protein